MIHVLAVWAARILFVLMASILLTEAMYRIGKLGREDGAPLDKRIRENIERNKRNRAA